MLMNDYLWLWIGTAWMLYMAVVIVGALHIFFRCLVWLISRFLCIPHRAYRNKVRQDGFC